MDEKENATEHLKLYSKNAITGATFLGGPLAAGYLIRENYLQLNEPEKGKKVLLYAVVISILLIGSLLLVPESVIDKIPRFIIPITYTALIALYLDKIQGTVLSQHKKSGNAFHSGWRAVVIGIISLLLVVAISSIFFVLSEAGTLFSTVNYEKNTMLFSKNEELTLSFYDHIETKSDAQLLLELDTKIIPKWKENILLIEENAKIKSLSEERKEENELLLKYARLRLETFETFRKGYGGIMENHEARLNMLHIEIDFVLNKLNK